LALGLASVPLAPALALEDSPANRRAQAVRYEAALPVADTLETNVLRVARVLPREHRQSFVDFAMLNLDRAQIRSTVLVVLTETFTADELRAMADFYGSRIGRSVAGKMALYAERITPLILMTVQDAATAYAKQRGLQQ